MRVLPPITKFSNAGDTRPPLLCGQNMQTVPSRKEIKCLTSGDLFQQKIPVVIRSHIIPRQWLFCYRKPCLKLSPHSPAYDVSSCCCWYCCCCNCSCLRQRYGWRFARWSPRRLRRRSCWALSIETLMPTVQWAKPLTGHRWAPKVPDTSCPGQQEHRRCSTCYKTSFN